ncbi:choline/carnitine/betaine transport [Nocardioides scoriae]|uniref:Choline/carnitine/betaine transport n=1 Tax=Nocardioides scoriae TaxID=642780 RepID=A0A1H1P841_9ACTN|nr:BCCT family transporter [Nocardioides scoriae]SDS06789.1 choline/carnitine/betaine transport [Nocardioides scoriae]
MTDTVSRETTGPAPGPDDGSATHRSLPLDKVVFGVAAAAVLGFVLWGALAPDAMGSATTSTLTWLEKSFGWLFVLTTAAFVVFSGYLAISRYGNLTLGPDDAEPEFSTFSWVSMMFATGMGIGLIFWGVAEPLTHLNTPPMGMAEPGTPEAARLAMEYTFFHWGLHPWAIYAVIGLAIAYFAYRKGYGNLISGTFRPLIGDAAGRAPGKAIDVVAIFATLFGSATSLGLGALQITGGLDNVFDGSGESIALALLVIWVLTACFVVSAVTGIEKGVQFLSNANAIAALVLVAFLFVVGPTVFILSTFTEGMGAYLTQLPTMSGRTGAFDADQATWLNGWTIFYWAWWVSWTPFVGMFIARISKGRTIRQFVVYVILMPSLVSFVWFSIMGGAAFDLQLNQGKDLGQTLADEGTESILFTVLRDYPLASITVVLAIFLIAIFFITGADSASIVMGMLSQHGEEEPKRWLVVFWGVAQGAVASVLLWSGGDDLRAGLTALQNLVIIVGGAFMIVIIAMCVSLMKALRAEPYESTLPTRIRRAVQHVQERDEQEQHSIALAALGADHEEIVPESRDPHSGHPGQPG